VLVTYHLQYFVAVQAGMIVGLAQQAGYRQKVRSAFLVLIGQVK
jgi:hypothetical protein